MIAEEKNRTLFVNAMDNEVEKTSQRILDELESATSTDLSDSTYAKMILQLSDINYTKQMLKQVESLELKDKN